MSDLISKAATISKLDALCDVVCQYSKKQRSVMCGSCPLGSAFDVIDEMPVIDPERKIGHWVEIGDEPYDEWECDVCGFVIDGSGCIDPKEYRDVYRFCPRCGSDMRGGEDE